MPFQANQVDGIKLIASILGAVESHYCQNEIGSKTCREYRPADPHRWCYSCKARVTIGPWLAKHGLKRDDPKIRNGLIIIPPKVNMWKV